MTLEARVDRLENALIRLAEAQERMTERVGELEARLLEFQLRTEERFARVEAQIEALTGEVRQLVERMGRVEAQIEALVEWQRGEAGRREGEQYERGIARRARRLFGAGWGGKPEDEPQLRDWLETGLESAGLEPAEDADPTLADLIWRKDDIVVVAEVSIAVDLGDIRRARLRADTLKAALGPGFEVMAAVIGRRWANERAQLKADQLEVEWHIEGEGPSPGLLKLRRPSNPA